MDRGRPLLRRISASLVLLLAACVEPAPVTDAPLTRDTLRALRWVAPAADKVRALTTEPVACRKPDEVFSMIVTYTELDMSDAVSVSSIDEGRMAFESPALLGGAAGRMGLSCASCHLNGRNNPDFFVEGVSGAPGTADVTNSIFSKTRGNGAFDPVPIPDISARDGKQIKDRRGAEFETKVHGLIVQEFDGREPGEHVLQAVIDYMDGLVPCPDSDARRPLDPARDMRSARQAFMIATYQKGDDRRLYARAARERLERLNERFVAANQADLRAALQDASQKIAAWLEAPDETDAALIQNALKLAGDRVQREAPRSLYNPDVMRAALER